MDNHLKQIKKAKVMSIYLLLTFITILILGFAYFFTKNLNQHDVLSTSLRIFEVILGVSMFVLIILLIIKSFSLVSKTNDAHYKKIGWTLIIFLSLRVTWGVIAASLRLTGSHMVYSVSYETISIVLLVISSLPVTISIIFFDHKYKESKRVYLKKIEETLNL